MITAEVRIQFCAGHRVYMHESKCSNIHGHNYVAYFTVVSDVGKELDKLGRVVDFGPLKDHFKKWIDTFWDHGFLVFHKDPLRLLFSEFEPTIGLKVFVCQFNPTAENLANYLLRVVAPELMIEEFRDFEVFPKVVKVRLLETENCAAEVSL